MRTELNYRTPLPENRRPQGALLVLSLVLAGAVYGGWYVLHDRDRSLFELVAEVPEQLSELALGVWPGGDEAGGEETVVVGGAGDDAPLQATRSSGAESGESVEPATDPGDLGTGGALGGFAGLEVRHAGAEAIAIGPEDADDDASPSSGEASSSARESGPATGSDDEARPAPTALRLSAEALTRPAVGGGGASVTGATGEAAAASAIGADSSAAEMLAALARDDAAEDHQPRFYGGGDEVRVILRARESSWIQVRSESRDYVRTRTLQPGDSFLVPNRADLALWTGNAGGLEVLVDGRPIAELGERGAVLRDVSLDPERLLERGGG